MIREEPHTIKREREREVSLYLARHHKTKPRPQYGSRQMAIWREEYSSHCSFMERQSALTAAWEICDETTRGDVRTPSLHQPGGDFLLHFTQRFTLFMMSVCLSVHILNFTSENGWMTHSFIVAVILLCAFVFVALQPSMCKHVRLKELEKSYHRPTALFPPEYHQTIKYAHKYTNIAACRTQCANVVSFWISFLQQHSHCQRWSEWGRWCQSSEVVV